MENLGKTLTRLFMDMEGSFFFKTKKRQKSFQTNNVKCQTIRHQYSFFESIGTMAGMSSYEYGENEQTRISIWYNHLSPFLHLKKVWKICITIWCARHARAGNAFFEKRVADDK